MKNDGSGGVLDCTLHTFSTMVQCNKQVNHTVSFTVQKEVYVFPAAIYMLYDNDDLNWASAKKKRTRAEKKVVNFRQLHESKTRKWMYKVR